MLNQSYMVNPALLTLRIFAVCSLIIDGVRYLRESAHFQDLQDSIANWWRGDANDIGTASQEETS